MTKAQAVVKAWGKRKFRHATRWGTPDLNYVEWDGTVLRLFYHHKQHEEVTDGWSTPEINDAVNRGIWIEFE